MPVVTPTFNGFSTIFEDLGSYIFQIIDYGGNLEDTGVYLNTTILSAILVAHTISIFWHGFNIIRGQGGNFHLLDVFGKSLRVILVVGLALADVTTFGTNITQFFVGDLNPTGTQGGLQQWLIEAFSKGTASANPFQDIDVALTAGEQAFFSVLSWAEYKLVPHLYWIGISWDLGTGIAGLLVAGIMFLIILALCILGFADLLVNYIALKLIFGLGPLFIACYAFEVTQKYFDSWMQAVLKWVFYNVFLVVVINIATTVLTFFANYVSTQSGASDSQIFEAMFGTICAMIALMMFFTKSATVAGDLTGGIGTGGMAQKLSQAISSTVKGAAQGAITGGPSGAARGALQGATGMPMGGGKGGGGGGGGGGGSTPGTRAIRGAPIK
jgi:type IV secretion system protein VirB6